MEQTLKAFLDKTPHTVGKYHIYLKPDKIIVPKKLQNQIMFGCVGACGFGSVAVKDLGDEVELEIIPCYCHPWSYFFYIPRTNIREGGGDE